MKLTLGGGLLLMALANPGAAPDPAGPPPVWHTDYAKARALALKQGKPLFLVFR